jgi:sec-independent protein translocase protein TatA
MFRNLADNPLLLIVLLLAIVVIFGSKRLPDAARSVGRSMRIFKSEMKDLREDGDRPAPGTPSRPLEGKVVDEPPNPGARRAEHPYRSDESNPGL